MKTILVSCLIAVSVVSRLFGADGGRELVQNGNFASGSIDPWQLIVLDGAAGTSKVVPEGPDKKPAALVNITTASQGGQAWQVGFNQGALKLSKGKKYRLTFQLKGSGVSTITAIVGPAHPPYGSLPGVERKEVPVKSDWQETTYEFTPGEDEPDARLMFYNFNATGATIYLSNISLTELAS